MITMITTIKELLQLYKGSESFVKFLIVGSNKFKEKNVGYKPGDIIYFNKYKVTQLRQTEFLFLVIFVITSISHDKTDKITIYSFITNREYSKSDDNVDLERAILLKLKNGMAYQVNLLISEFLFCNNDDIIVLVSKDIAGVDTIKTNMNKLLQSKRFRKEDIAKISIGQAELKYDTERGWYKI